MLLSSQARRVLLLAEATVDLWLAPIAAASQVALKLGFYFRQDPVQSTSRC